MRKIIILFAIAFSSTNGFAQGGWILRQSNTNHKLRSISTASGQNIVAVGDSGAVVTSSDAGVTWEQQKPIVWISPFLSGANPNPSDTNLNGVTAISEKIFCSVGPRDTVYRSLDGGHSWKAIRSHAKGNCCTFVACDPNVHLYEIRGIDYDRSNTTCIASADAGVVVFSADSGRSWKENLPNSIENLKSVSASSGQYLASAWLGSLLYSTDLGETWVSDWVLKNVNLWGCDVKGWTAVGDSGMIFHTLDKGKNWFPIASGSTAKLNAVHFADKANGYIVGDGGLVMLTDDGGSSWKRQFVPTKENLRSVHFVDPFVGFICGDNGTILTTINGGYSTGGVDATPQGGYSIKAYPNPASSRSIISVNLPHHSLIHLKIYNMLGEEVATLANGSFSEGMQSFIWNIGTVANGVYVCRLETDGMILQSQIIVQK